MIRRAITVVVLVGLVVQWHHAASACGPPYFGSIFVFKESPDLPFSEFVGGKIGIVRPTFGRKTLFIAYRYLNGGTFTLDEQEGLVNALRGKPPEDEGEEALKAWVSARKEVFADEKEPPTIYREREYGGYDFFPNCAKNAFEVANATLKARVSTYGTDDRNLREWLAAQDLVFQNCQSGGVLPAELGPNSPTWLRKDRDYQIAAALLYSLNFEEARTRFIRIANDLESPWRETAEYLVGRTLVRQASLIRDEPKKLRLYEEAEQQLAMIATRHGKFSNAAQKLLALVKYRVRPDDRVRELAALLTNQFGNENLKQDLIDFVWLLDKIEDRILKEEEKRRRALTGQAVDEEKPDG